MSKQSVNDILTPQGYKIRSGTIDSGQAYEIRTTALLSLICCVEDLEHFWIASNGDHFGELDDIILFIKEKNKQGVTYLIQLKHQDVVKNIVRNQMLAKSGKFSLKKYLECCSVVSNKISGQVEEMSDIILFLTQNPGLNYILFTNKDVADNLEFLKPVVPNPAQINVDGTVYGFKSEELEDIFSSPDDPKKQFIEKIFLYARQPHIKRIDNDIKIAFKELTGLSNKPDGDLGEFIRRFVCFVEDWYRGWLNGHYPLTKTPILKKITEILLEPFMVKLNLKEDVEEEEEEKYIVWNEMIRDKDLIVINGSDETVVEFIEKFVCRFIFKHKWSIGNYKIKKDLMRVPGTFQTNSLYDTYEYLWKTRQMPLVIQVCSRSEIEEVTRILKMQAFRVIVLNKSEDAIDHLSSFKTLVAVSDLKVNQQKRLFNSPIKLQGRYVSSYHELNLDIKEILTLQVKDIICILCNKFNIGGEFEKLPDVFVDISFKRVCLSANVLKNLIEDIFVIHCEFKQSFRNFLKDESIEDSEITEWKDNKHLKFDNRCRIVLHENFDNLKPIKYYISTRVKTKSRSIHFLISHSDFKLEWIETQGTTRNLKKFRKPDKFLEKRTVTKKAIKEFCTDKKSIIISSNPGMGKSVFVDYFARNAPIDLWVVKINLAKYKAIYKNFLNESDCNCSLKGFFEQILKEECKGNLLLAKAIFEKFLEPKNIILLLDGFDEIPISYQIHAKEFIKFLNGSGYFIVITTRPVLKNDLELLFDNLSLDLALFTRDDQRYFLENYFANNAEIACKPEIIFQFVDNLLDATQKNLNRHDNEFTGIPLQTLLLAEIFLKEFTIFVKTRKFVNKYFDLLYLYREFIRRKIQIACEKFGDISEDMILQYKNCRTVYALRLLFSKEDLEELRIDLKLQTAKSLFPHTFELVQKDGIVVAETETDIRFVHQTFAEYLVGEWLAENIKNKDAIATKLLKLTFDPNMKIVRNIFDRILAERCPLHLAIINFQTDKVATLIGNCKHFDELDGGGRSFLHVLASRGLHHPKEYSYAELCDFRKLKMEDEMVRMLQLIPDVKLKNVKDHILEYTPIDYALISSSLDIANLLCEKMRDPRLDINMENLNKPFVLDYCIQMRYLFLNRVIINNKCIESKLLLDKESEQFNSLISKGTSAIHSTPLHVAVRSQREEIVEMLIDSSANVNVNVSDDSGKTPLHWSVIFGNLSITKLLISNEASVNAVDVHNRTALHYAITACPQHQLEIISELSNTNLDIIDRHNMTAFLWAAYYGYTECVNLLLRLNVDIEQKNEEGLTALHCAASSGHIDTVELLLSNGANINATTITRNATPLVFSVYYAHANLTDFLISRGADLKLLQNVS